MDPAAQAPLCSVPTTTPLVFEKHKLVWTCHSVRQPPGIGGVCPTWLLAMAYMAATRIAPCEVLA